MQIYVKSPNNATFGEYTLQISVFLENLLSKKLYFWRINLMLPFKKGLIKCVIEIKNFNPNFLNHLYHTVLQKFVLTF